MQVDRRTENHVDALGTALAGQHLADPLCSGLVPGLGQQRGVRKQRHPLPADELAATNTGRTVAEDHRAQPDDIVAVQREAAAPVSSVTLVARSSSRIAPAITVSIVPAEASLRSDIVVSLIPLRKLR